MSWKTSTQSLLKSLKRFFLSLELVKETEKLDLKDLVKYWKRYLIT